MALVLLNLLVTSALAADTDNDSIDDSIDNCTNIPNIEQRDTDNDGYGNRCDVDISEDCLINVFDLGILRSQFYTSTLYADLNGDGDIDHLDLLLSQPLFLLPIYQQSNVGNCLSPSQ